MFLAKAKLALHRQLKSFVELKSVVDLCYDGKKIPKWEPCSRQGQFLGFSKEHATTIGLIRNTRTGYISPKFHGVYDEQFTTVTSDSSIDLQEHWIDLFLNSHESYLDVHDESVDGPIPELDMEYQPPDPREYSNQGKPQEHVGQGKPSQAIESPTLTQQPLQPQAQQHPAHNQAADNAPVPDDSFNDYHNPQEVVPTTLRPSDSSCVLPDDQLFDDFNNKLLKALLVYRNPRAAVLGLLKLKSLHHSLNKKSTIQKGVPQSPFVLDD
eukprot:scaffold7139_cov100-Amphora_coffeaeformis.AAC.2